MKDVTLAICPFCSGGATQPENLCPHTKRSIWEITCSSRCIHMRRGTRKEVINDWNTRGQADRAISAAIEYLAEQEADFTCMNKPPSLLKDALSSLLGNVGRH